MKKRTHKSVWDKNVSPVDWYVGSYQLRFVEFDRKDLESEEARFLTWENTVLVKAKSLDAAYDRVVEIAMESTHPYKGGPEAVDVQWQFEGITDLLPVYEEIEDGCEIIWAEHAPRMLRNIRAGAVSKDDCKQ